MIDKHVMGKAGGIVWAGVAVCAGALAFLQSIVNKDSTETVEFLTFIRYLIIDSVCFSISLLIIGRWQATALKRILNCSAVALLGAIACTMLIDIPFFSRDLPNWPDITGWYIHAATFMFINICLAVVAMILVYGIGAMVTGDID